MSSLLYLAYGIVWLFRFALGACVFSFLNVVAARLPRGESILRGRSHCEECGHTLAAWELIPCISFLLLGGKCHACGARLSPRYVLTETLGGALSCACALRFGGESFWSDIPLWSAFATLAALVAVAGLAASLLPGGRLRPAVAEKLALGGLAGLAVFWVLIALPRVDSDRGFLLTAALGALGVAVWLSPSRRRSPAGA